MPKHPHKTITLFWSFRSPYSYLALPRLQSLSESTGVAIDMRVVHPNILRNPNYLKTMNALARWLGHLGIAATEAGRAFNFFLEVSRLLWNGAVDQWHEGDYLKNACHQTGLDWSALSAQVSARPDYYEQQLQANADALTAAGHWGVPTMVYGPETFFGQDRIDVLAWCIQKDTTT